MGSMKLLKKIEQTAGQVLDLFPDLTLAVEEQEPELAHEFFSTGQFYKSVNISSRGTNTMIMDMMYHDETAAQSPSSLLCICLLGVLKIDHSCNQTIELLHHTTAPCIHYTQCFFVFIATMCHVCAVKSWVGDLYAAVTEVQRHNQANAHAIR